MKAKVWTQDWFWGLVFSLVFITSAYLIFPAAFAAVERWGFDWGMQLNEREPSPDIAIVAIDDKSIENLGRWPWPRNLHADMIDKLGRAGAKVVGNSIFYSEGQTDPGQVELDLILRQFSNSSLSSQVIQDSRTVDALLDEIARLPNRGAAARKTAELTDMYKDSALRNQMPKDLAALANRLLQAKQKLDGDAALAASYADTAVAQGFYMEPGYLRGRPDPSPEHLAGSRLPGGDVQALPTVRMQAPIANIGKAATIQGHLITIPDIDGVQRYEPLVTQYFDEFYPSLSLAIALKALNLTAQDVELAPEIVRFGGLRIGTTPDFRMLPHFYQGSDGQTPFAIDSFFDVLVGNIDAEKKYRDKVVLLGATATGVGDALSTPVAGATAPVEVLAHTVSSILKEDFYNKPAWGVFVTLAGLLLVALWLCLGLPRLSAGIGFGISATLFLILVATTVGLMAAQALWVPLLVPAAMLVLGHLFMTVKSLQVTEVLKARSDMESADSNRMLGIAFQSQGQLDMAFEKFRKCPANEDLLDPLYNLALDYERKRQFNKAISVYEHLRGIDSNYRDAKARMTRAQDLSDKVLQGGTIGAGTLLLSGDGLEKPMLGRYEVLKELGKGAMGIVYLGQDPKIGRTVAIKTMALAREFEADELDEVKERFFREAETAGRLAHPNIVTIYDAGEEHDLAYIAMELVKGYDLDRHVKYDKLLETNEAIRLIADAADALGYAHQQGVTHRDIKPSNMMLMEDTRVIKLMDFGIARLSDSSKTKTGMVLGTPSYMSPEQMTGKKVDGRTDLFSLGVTLYQLLCGRLPFNGDSMAALMFMIANEPHEPVTKYQPRLDPRIDAIIDKAMSKDREQRYQRGEEMAADLRALLR